MSIHMHTEIVSDDKEDWEAVKLHSSLPCLPFIGHAQWLGKAYSALMLFKGHSPDPSAENIIPFIIFVKMSSSKSLCQNINRSGWVA